MKNPCYEILEGAKEYAPYPYWMTRCIDYSIVSGRWSTPDWTTYHWNEEGRAVKVPKMSLEEQVKDLLG